tara:strand:+ start:1869 stop:3401 length:1533 start_codon:yes stop_codon:yes gene_type:complete
MNILTDVLNLIRRGVFAKKAQLDDVIVLGVNEQPDMTGVASPIPYKSIKVIKVRDFKVAAEHCDHANSPAFPPAGTGQVYQKTEVDPTTQDCTVYYRSLKSMSSNLTLATSADDDFIEITTEGEPNTAANVGTGQPLWKDKVGETLNFRTIIGGSGINITQSNNALTVDSTGGNGVVQSLTTTGTTGPATLNMGTGVLNIPDYADANDNTTYQLGSSVGVPGEYGLKLIGSDSTVSTVTLKAGTNVTFTPNGVELTISASASGEVNTASNVGTGEGIFKQKDGVDLEFKKIRSSDGSILITPDGTDTINLVQEGMFVESNVGSGKFSAQFVSGSGGTTAMTGLNFKVCGRETMTHAGQTNYNYSSYIQDWTESDVSIDAATSYVLPEEAVFNAAIPFGVALKTGDQIILNYLITNDLGASQQFSSVVGWFECVDTNPWPVTLRDVATFAGPNAQVGASGKEKQFECSQVTSTLTTDSSGACYVIFGFNFTGGNNNDVYNVNWSLTVRKAR